MARYLRRNRTEIGVAIKYTLFLTNVVFWLCGLALTFVGTYALIEKRKVVRDAIDFFFDPSSLITLIGSVSIVVSFFGCWGALRENTCLLKLYFHTLWILFFGEIVLICLVLIFYFMPQIRKQMHLFPEKEFHKAIVKYRDDADMQNMIDNMQKSLKCCGLSDDDDGYLDWNDNEYFNCTDSNPSSSRCSVPPSCCKMKPGSVINVMCGADALKADDPQAEAAPKFIYSVGCLKAMGSWLKSHALLMLGVIAGVLIPQLVVLCLSRTLTDQIQYQRSKWEHMR